MTEKNEDVIIYHVLNVNINGVGYVLKNLLKIII